MGGWNMFSESTSGGKPRLLVFAGPNGSGKSTVTKGLPIVGLYVNADEIKRIAGCTDLEAAQEADRGEVPPTDLRAVCDVLRASNADLRAEVSRLWAQLATKDEQIHAAHDLADQAHRLHAAEVTRALPEGRTLRERIKSLFGRTS